MPAADRPGPRIYSKVRHLWIHEKPNAPGWIGYLSLGGSVRIKGASVEEALAGDGTGQGCRAWYAIEPKGFVCAGDNATFDATDPAVVELLKRAADTSSPWPYNYGESMEIPVYASLPDHELMLMREWNFRGHLEEVERAKRVTSDDERRAINKRLVGIDLSPAGKGPPAAIKLPEGGMVNHHRIAYASTVAYTDSFDHQGRTFLFTWDRGIVPKDKVRPFPRSSFEGVVLGGDVGLPIAFFREKPRPKYRREGAGFVPAGTEWPRLGWVELTGKSAEVDGERFLETKEAGMWCRRRDAAVADKSAELPKGIRERAEGRRTWLDISILGGTLVAYEYDRPVYATLISPGRGGVPVSGRPPIDTASTPVGTYGVLGKFATATMVSSTDANLVHAEVMYTQNFSGPHALHGAYWHDAWGEKKSGGCVNLSPIDSQRIFAWTEPSLPPGWHGLRSSSFGPYTLIVLRH
jgi:hypothetical protein